MKPLNVAVLASGGGTNLQTVIDAAQNNIIKSNIKCVISNKEDAYALKRAKKASIEDIYINPKEGAYNARLLEILKAKGIDLIVLAGYLKIIPEEIISKYPKKIINIHPSLLPKYGGKGYYGIHVHEAVIANKEKYSGATVHYVDNGIDTGQIILQETIEVQSDDTPQSLQEKILSQIEHKILVKAIRKLEESHEVVK